jgi:diguanylate cyclase (GGDEF)-like protein/PAS domain S-box-containing protein
METRASRTQPRVLIADDDPSTRLIMREVLEQAGFEVVEAVDGKEALDCYESDAPDIVLLDVEMPHLDGFSVCKKIRDKETTRKVPICMVTGLDDSESIDRAYHVGATDFISKPIAWPVLGHRVRYLIRANEALNEIRGLVLALPDGVFILDDHGRTYGVIPEIDASYAGQIGSLNGLSFEDIIRDEDRSTVQKCINVALLSGEPQVHEYYLSRRNIYLEIRFVVRDKRSVIAIVRDITERKQAEQQIHNLAFYDRLTGLPNRQLFSKELDAIIESTRRQQLEFAVLFLDLDRFKRINDTLGHSIGDELLKAVATRLHSCLRAADSVVRANQQDWNKVRLARLGGDEFVIVLRDVGSEDAAASIASRIIDSLSEPFNFEGHQFVITPSIGIAIYPQDGETNDELLMNADSAMYKAKAAGRNIYKSYSSTMKIRSLHRLEMENELRRAIDSQHFELYYQPKVDLSSFSIAGAEALLRWRHSSRGWISPVDFIPVAEETGLILPLGKWVLQAACRQLGEWQHSPLHKISVSVNVSSRQMHPDDLPAIVSNAVADAGIEAEQLDLEITEGLLMRDVESTIETLKRLKDFGLGISVDDFGTGYSSLSYLKRFPIDELKIDRSFVQDLHRDADDAAICAAIMAMARQLGLKVVAEGVELEEQLEFLRRHNCDQIQGYFFSKPLPAKEFEKLVVAHSDRYEKAAG